MNDLKKRGEVCMRCGVKLEAKGYPTYCTSCLRGEHEAKRSKTKVRGVVERAGGLSFDGGMSAEDKKVDKKPSDKPD
jgi:hypothetical protein